MDEQKKLALAKRQVAKITAFYIHLTVFVLVMIVLAWGIGLLAHGLSVFGGIPQLIRNWQQRKIKEIKDRM
jgi:hypothetical protein